MGGEVAMKGGVHALMFPYPAQGHTKPMLELAKKLVSKGMPVTFINILSDHLQLISDGLSVVKPTRPPSSEQETEKEEEEEEEKEYHYIGYPQLRLVGLPDGLPLSFDRRSQSPEFHDAVNKMGPTLKEFLLLRLRRWNEPITCFISDHFLHWTEPICHSLDIPWVYFCTQSSLVFLISYLCFLPRSVVCNGNSNILTSQEGDYKNYLNCDEILDTINSIPGIPEFRFEDLPTYVYEFVHNRNTKDLGYRMFCPQLEVVSKADIVLVNSFCSLEEIIVEYMSDKVPIHYIGPLVPSEFLEGAMEGEGRLGREILKGEQLECLEWLDTRAAGSVLYVSFGSFVPLVPEQIMEIGHGLMASKAPFLWVLRGGKENSLAFPMGFAKKMEDQGRVITWAPQLNVISHAAVGGFLTHCGWNSVSESICAGVPMLGMPYFSDQMTNSKMVVDMHKIGLACHPKRRGPEEEGPPSIVTREEVELKVRMLMQGEEGNKARKRAQEMSKVARRAVSPLGSSDRTLQTFVEEMAKRAVSSA